MKLFVKSLKEGRNCVFDPSLRIPSTKRFFSLVCLKTSFGSWRKLLGPSLSTRKYYLVSGEGGKIFDNRTTIL